MSCVSKKKTYNTWSLAEDALIDARTRYEHRDGNGLIAVYKCEDCGHYHLTSTGPVNERLLKLMAEGKILKQQEAQRWSEKLDKKTRK